MPAVTVARCLGCAARITLPHQCAKNRELSVTGGYCGCTEPGCGPSGKPAKPGRTR